MLVHQLHPFLEKRPLTIVIHASLTSRLNYCNALYAGLPLKTIQDLQLMPKAATPLPIGARCLDHVIAMLGELNWLPVCFHVQFKVIIVTYCIKLCTSKCLLHKESIQTLRSSGEALHVPCAMDARLASTRGQGFASGGTLTREARSALSWHTRVWRQCFSGEFHISDPSCCCFNLGAFY